MPDLTTLANVKQWAPIATSTTSDDTLLGRLITACSNDFMRATLRPDLLEANYTEVQQGDGGARITLYHWPIIEITSLKINGTTVAASPDKIQAGYYVDGDIDPERVFELYVIGQAFTDGVPIAIAYTAGYAEVPEDIEQAVIDWIVARYKGRPNVSTLRRRSNEGEEVEVEQNDAPATTLAVIDRYKRRLPSVNRRIDSMAQRVEIQKPRRVR